FEGFVKIVDLLGGIDINASIAMEDRCDLNATGWCRVEPGITHMDGQTALWYARARYATSDFDRTRRAQEVIKALAQKSISLNTLIKSGKLFDTFGEYVDTNVTTGDLLPFITKIGSLTSEDAITSYYITENEAYSYFTEAGANVLVPDLDAIRLILDKVLFITTP
ncbi:MAG: LCP family protein, partial [Anaerolineaceae bacterium]|nr:LCP family protein [Anaerolineaceae bacterium]